MMNTKSPAIMIIAIAVGYLLISAVPDEVARYTSPRPQLLTEPGPDEHMNITRGPLEIASVEENSTVGEDQPLTDLGVPDGEVLGKSGPDREEYGFSSMTGILKWWIMDLLLAVTIYFFARQRL